ncbi:hypothetical protein HerbRD11066_62770 [Herbidospora sp. RD11066]
MALCRYDERTAMTGGRPRMGRTQKNGMADPVRDRQIRSKVSRDACAGLASCLINATLGGIGSRAVRRL